MSLLGDRHVAQRDPGRRGLPDGTGKVAGGKEGVGSQLGCKGSHSRAEDMVGFTGLM